MSDVDRASVVDEDRLPWLEAVDDDAPRGSGGAGTGTLVAALIAALVALGLIVGGVFWLRDRGQPDTNGEGELIAAPAGDYKEKPATPGGMKVEGQGDAAYAASTGATVNSSIDIAAVPEAPVKGAGSAKAESKPVVAPAAKPAKPAVAVAATGKTVAGGTIQLGAFSSSAKANEAWKSLSGRFAYLKPYAGAVTPVSIGKGTMYRLRAGVGGEAQTICGKLKVAGETCAVVSN